MARPRRRRATAEPLSRRAAWSNGCSTCRARMRPPRSPAMLDRLDAEERFALLKMATGGAAHRRVGAARQDRARAGVRARGRCGRGSVARHRARPMPRCSTGPRGAARSRPPPTCRCSARSCSRTRSRSCASTSPTMPPSGNGTASASRSSMSRGETRLYSRAGDDITGSFPEVAARFRDARRARRRADGEGRVPGRRRAGRRRGELQRAPAAARAQDRVGQDAGRLSRVRPALRHPVRRRTRICARCPGPSGARGWKRSPPRLDPDRFDRQRGDRRRRFRRARGDPRRRARRRDRGRDAQAPRLAPMSPGAAPGCGTNGSATRSPPIA